MSQPLIYKALDEVFSLVVRSRAHWICLGCGSQHNPPEQMLEFPDDMKKSSSSLHCSHFWGKGSGSVWTRWDDLGSDAFCVTCHHKYEKLKAPSKLYYKIKLDDLGLTRFSFMDWLSNQAVSMSPDVGRFRLIELLCELSEKWPTEWLIFKYEGLIEGCPDILQPEQKETT